MECQADEGGPKMQNDLAAQMAERVVDTQQTYLEASEETIKDYSFG